MSEKFGERRIFQSPQPGEKSSGSGAEKTKKSESAELELSPEMLEGVMEKVEDIDKPGTAYSFVGQPSEGSVEHISSILNDGLIPREYQSKIERWWDKPKHTSDMNQLNYFNIVGREKIPQERIESCKGSPEINCSSYAGRGIGMLIDVSFLQEMKYKQVMDDDKVRKFIENPTARGQIWFYPYMQYGEYAAFVNLWRRYDGLDDSSEELLRRFSDNKLPRPHINGGFVTGTRIPPRRLKGIVVSTKWLNQEDNRLDAVFNTMIDVARKTTKSRLLPIYDTDGNLLWPKQMSYEEVKKFVAERETKKSEPEQKE